MSPRQSTGLTALGKAAVVLEALDTPRSLSDVADTTSLPLPTVHRILHEIADFGWVHRTGWLWTRAEHAPGGDR